MHNYRSNNQSTSINAKPNNFQPSQSLVDNWKLWMAIEVVEQLKSSELTSLQLSSIINTLDFSKRDVFVSQFDKLNQKISFLNLDNISIENVGKVKDSLEKYYFDTIDLEMQKSSQELTIITNNKLRQLLSEDIKKASPQKLMKLLEDLVKILASNKNDFEKSKIGFIKQENAAWNAYYNLIGSSFSKSEYLDNKESICKALSICFISRLQVSKYSIFSQTILNIIQICQSYYDSCRRSKRMLDRIQASLSKKCSLNLISLPVFTMLNRIDISEQKKLIEMYTGHHLNSWGSALVSWQQIEAKLLENLDYIALKLYKDLQTCFMEDRGV